MARAVQKLKIPWPEFGDSVQMALAGYRDEIQPAVAKEAEKAAKRTRNDIQSAAPRRSGQYAKTWTVKRDIADRRRPVYVVHAAKPGYQLAHLLERSHRIANQYGDHWGHTAGQPHIEPAAVQNGETFRRNVVNIIRSLS